MTTDDERTAYLAGEGSGAMDDLERRDLDELKGFLADPAVWAEPEGDLEDLVVAAIAAEAAGPVAAPKRAVRERWRHPGFALGAVAAAAAVLVAAVLVVPDDRGSSPPLAATLAPTDLAPNAAGKATFTRTDSGWRIELDATGLPRRDDGRFYQAWLKGDDDVLVAIGSFNEGEDVVLWAGVSPLDHPTLTITEEAADGDPASSGRRVLVGAIDDP
jgi:hypothetical protein